VSVSPLLDRSGVAVHPLQKVIFWEGILYGDLWNRLKVILMTQIPKIFLIMLVTFYIKKRG
jgi:hypothetical protein